MLLTQECLLNEGPLPSHSLVLIVQFPKEKHLLWASGLIFAMVTLSHLHSSSALDSGSGCRDLLAPPGPLEKQIHTKLDSELLVLNNRVAGGERPAFSNGLQSGDPQIWPQWLGLMTGPPSSDSAAGKIFRWLFPMSTIG